MMMVNLVSIILATNNEKLETKSSVRPSVVSGIQDKIANLDKPADKPKTSRMGRRVAAANEGLFMNNMLEDEKKPSVVRFKTNDDSGKSVE